MLDTWGITIPDYRIKETMFYAYFAGMHMKTGGRLGLKYLSKAVFGYEQEDLGTTFRRAGVTKHNYDTSLLSTMDIGDYAADDALCTLRLYNYLKPLVNEKDFVFQLECELRPYVKRIEDNGFPVNEDYLRDEYYRVQDIANTQEIDLREELGVLGTLRGDEAKLKLSELCGGLPKTPNGKPKTDEETRLDYLHIPIMRRYHTWLSYQGRVSKIPSYTQHIQGGRIHGNLRQIGAVSTGRFSASEPNMQNVGKALGDGDDLTLMRKGFVASEGHYLVELDYGQIELILMAYLAEDVGVMEAYRDGVDLHTRTASLMYGVETPTKEQRQVAKTINFAIGYGCGVTELARQAGLTYEEAKARRNDWYRVHPKIRDYHRDCVDELERDGYVVTKAGRVQRKAKYDNAYTTALNKKVQGFAADIQKMGLVATHKAVDNWFTRQNWSWCKPQCVAQTHDSQTWMVDDNIPKEVIIPLLIKAMSSPPKKWKGEVPDIKVDAQVGLNWNDLEPYKGE